MQRYPVMKKFLPFADQAHNESQWEQNKKYGNDEDI